MELLFLVLTAAGLLTPTETVAEEVPIVEVRVLTVQEKIIEEAISVNYPSERALKIAKCESGFDPKAKSKTSSASGVFQFIKSTWQQTLTEMNQPTTTSPFDEDMNIKAALYLLSNGGEGHWDASRHCWG